MQDFWGWLLERREVVPQSVLQSYESAFKEALKNLISRTKDPVLRDTFIAMLDCPIVDRRGNCRKFSEYIVTALIRNDIQEKYDIEAALSYIFDQMMLDRSMTTGKPRDTVFGQFDEKRPYKPGDNPLQARFLTWLTYAIRNIRKDKIPRLAKVEPRPQGTVSIGQGRRREGDPSGEVSPEQIAARQPPEAELRELAEDIAILLRQKEGAYGLPLVDVFRDMLQGKTSDEQKMLIGDHRTKVARQVIRQTVEEYAEKTGNHQLLGLLRRMREPEVTREIPKPRMKLPEKERDYRSIASVIARFDRPIGLAELGRFRRRWLEYSPRQPNSGYRNRLEEVLVRMVQDEVLQATRTRNGALLYSPGKHFGQYRQEATAGV